MWHWLGRIVLAIGFLGAVWGAVANPAAQGQATDKHKMALPFLVRKAAITAAPAYRDYVGVLYADPDGNSNGSHYTVRGDGSDWRQITGEGTVDGSMAWSPNALYFLYIQNGTTRMIRLSDLSVMVTLPLPFDAAVWSPDSRTVLLHLTSGQMVLYHVARETLDEAPTGFLMPTSIRWSDDSRHVAWFAVGGQPDIRELWLWNRDMPVPRLQGEGTFNDGYPHRLYWSPGGTRIALTGWDAAAPSVPRILVSHVGQTGVEMILEGYYLHGWVHEGERLFVQQAGQNYQIFIASSDGSALVPLSDPTLNLEVAMTASSRDIVYIYDGTRFLHRVGETEPFSLGPAYCTYVSECFEYFRWKEDGTRLLNIFGISTRAGTWTNYDMWDATQTPPRFVTRVSDMDPAIQFLPFADNYLAITNYTGGYPGPSYVDSYIFNGNSDDTWHVPYDLNGQSPVVEWRYLP